MQLTLVEVCSLQVHSSYYNIPVAYKTKILAFHMAHADVLKVHCTNL